MVTFTNNSTQVIDASTETTDLPIEPERVAPPSELAQLRYVDYTLMIQSLLTYCCRSTIMKLKATIDSKEEVIQFLDERLSCYEPH